MSPESVVPWSTEYGREQVGSGEAGCRIDLSFACRVSICRECRTLVVSEANNKTVLATRVGGGQGSKRRRDLTQAGDT